MKTIGQIAEEIGVTREAIYKKIKNYGLTIDKLNSEKQGNTRVYDEDAERLIRLIFGSRSKTKDGEEDERTAAAEARAAAAEAQAEKAEARAERAEAQIEILLQQVDKLTDAIRAAEAIQAARLMSPEQAKGKGGFLARLFGGRGHKEK